MFVVTDFLFVFFICKIIYYICEYGFWLFLLKPCSLKIIMKKPYMHL